MFLFKKVHSRKSIVESRPSLHFLGTRNLGLGTDHGFTLVELIVTVGIFVFMTALVVAKYGSFNDGTLLTSMAYDVALTLRSAQSYGLNVQSYNSQNLFNYPYGMHFTSASPNNTQMIFFADSYPVGSPNMICDNGIGGTCTSNQTIGDSIITTYTLARGGDVKSLCVTNSPPIPSTPCSSLVVATSLDITFKRPDPNAIIMANGTKYAYAEIKVENAAKNSTRTIVVRGTGEIAVQNQ